MKKEPCDTTDGPQKLMGGSSPILPGLLVSREYCSREPRKCCGSTIRVLTFAVWTIKCNLEHWGSQRCHSAEWRLLLMQAAGSAFCVGAWIEPSERARGRLP